jgi:hypothetical protein
MLKLPTLSGFHDLFLNEIIPSINRSFVYKAKEGRHVKLPTKLQFIGLRGFRAED